MDYKLAKKLEGAGFPQKGSCGHCGHDRGLLYVSNGEPRTIDGVRNKKHKLVYKPTLSELIEACGEDFGILVRAEDGMWTAANENHQVGECEGRTPIEAIVRFWLVLNDK